jgi:glycerophosphoryl diester phosphodiesterase
MRYLIVVAAATVWAAPSAALAQTCPAADAVINCGHRGTGVNAAGNDYAENTVPSLQQAVIEGADMIEIDVVHSSDGVLMVIHDDTVDRTTDGSGCVGEMTVADLQALDAAFGTSMEGTGVVIPTLDEVLTAIDVDFNIELKINDAADCPDSDKPQMAADVVAAIEADTKSRTIVTSSFDAVVLTEIEALAPAVYTGFLTTVPDDAPTAVAGGFDAINVLSLTIREQQTVDDLVAMGLEVNVWTENNEFAMQDMIEFGVNMVITDEPDLFLTARQTWCDLQTEGNGDGGCSASNAARSWPVATLLLLGLAMLRRRRSS